MQTFGNGPGISQCAVALPSGRVPGWAAAARARYRLRDRKPVCAENGTGDMWEVNCEGGERRRSARASIDRWPSWRMNQLGKETDCSLGCRDHRLAEG